MIFCSTVAIFTTIGIIFALVFETAFFQMVPITEFLFGTNWEPQIPIREDQIAAEGAFGWLPVFLGTIVITVVAMFIATFRSGCLSAIYLNEFAPRGCGGRQAGARDPRRACRRWSTASSPSSSWRPAMRSFGQAMGPPVAPNTALAAGGVMGIMLIPFISSFADDALSAVPRSLRDGALALGATRGETMLNVLFPAAIPASSAASCWRSAGPSARR
jgi:phosphate transport system permease protein